MEIKVHTTNKPPEDIAPFAMVPAFVWKLYDSGRLNPKELALMTILYRHVNAYDGKGRTSYQQIATWLKMSASEKNVNGINKMMAHLRNELHLVWFQSHKGIKDFAYVLADFKLAKKSDKETDKWVDIKPYFQTSKQNLNTAMPEHSPEPAPRWAPENQRLERRNNNGFQSIGEVMGDGEIRPPHTNTNP